MKISQKLFLGFVAIALLIVFIGFLYINASQKALQKSIGENSLILAQEVLDKIDRSIYYRIERWKAYAMSNPRLNQTVLFSNQEFEKLDNIQAYINQKDKEWVSAQKGELTPFMQEIIVNNKLSERLRKRAAFYKDRYGYNVFPEIYVANKYGVVIASTGRTSDYWQADEQWYQKAISEKEFWVGEVEYDESSDAYAMDIVVKLYEGTEFIGIFKAVLNLEEMINIIKAEAKNLSTEIKLITEDGKILYSTEEFKIFENIPDKLLSCFKHDESISYHEHLQYLVMEGDKPGEGEELFAHAHSRGFKDYKGLGWILITEHKTKEIFAPVIKLKSNLLASLLAVTILALLMGFFISRGITKPLKKLKDAAVKVGKGELDIRLEIASRNEIGELADLFNKMSKNLHKITVSRDALAQEVAKRKKAVEASKLAYAELNQIFDSAADGMRVIDKDFNVLRVNRTFLNISGASKAEAEGKKCYDVFCSTICHTPDCTLNMLLGGKEYVEFDVEKERTDGTKVPCILTATPFRARGKLLGIIESFKDVSERKQAEVKIKQLSDIVEQSMEGIASANLDGILQYANTSWVNMHGYKTGDELIGKHLSIFHTEDQLKTDVIPHIAEVKSRGYSSREIGHTRKDGSIFPGAMSVSLLEDEQGVPIGINAFMVDITERKQAEEALRENEEKFRAFWETANDSMNITDKDGFFTDVNEATVKILGYSKEELIGMHVSRVLKNKANFEPKMEELIRTGKISLEVSWITKNGEEVYGELMVVAIYDEDGKYAGGRGIFRDLTERKQVDEEQKKYTAELELTRAEIEKQNWLKTGQTELNNMMRGEQDIETLSKNTISYLAKYLNAQIGAFYIADDKENVLRLFGSYAYQKPKNLSKEFKFGEGLVGQAALEKESITLNNCPDDYIRINSGLGDAVPRNIIVFPCLHNNIVQGLVELGSFKEFSDLDLSFLDLVSDGIAIAVNSAQSRNQMATLLEQTQKQAEELQAQQEELRQTNKELEEQTQLLEEQKEDIQKKNVQLQKAQKLIEEKARDHELTSMYKSEFLANMSHELRTPLNSILLLSKILSDNKDANLIEKQVELADTIYSSGSDLLALINEILDLSKLEAGKIKINLSELNLGDFKERMIRYFGHLAEEKGVNFRIQVEEGVPIHIRTDPQRLEQIVKNILSNAFKFTFQGSVTLNICRPDKQVDLSKSGLRPEKTIAFSVSDTGIGIPKEKKKLIFEAFQQIDGTTSRKYGGTGLGLSISRELANLLGGEIQLESEEGKGSTFTLYLPETAAEGQQVKEIEPLLTMVVSAAEPANVQAIESAAPSASLEGIKDDRKNIRAEDKSILIIEDDPKFTKILRDLSREKGFKVLAARDGETGYHLADYYKPSAIILDIRLPGIDGWAVMSRLKNNPDTRHIPLHFISVFDKKLDAMKMGAIGFLTKPVSMEMLEQGFEKIERIISKPVKNLLVVEDDEIQRKAITELIGNGGVLITSVSTGEVAYDRVTSGKFDCMILNIDLSDMSGVELISRIGNNEDLLDLPIIIYTGRELTKQEKITLDEYAEKIIIKRAKSAERLLDEATLFLHHVEANLPEEKRKILRMIHDKEAILKDKKILLVDDDMRNIFALTNILEEKGMQVLVGKNGKEGLERLNKNPDVDMVLMDIMMPEMDGYEAIREIRKQERFRKLPIVALTAKAMKGDRAKCIEAGASDYLAKPVDTEKLFSMLRVWLY